MAEIETMSEADARRIGRAMSTGRFEVTVDEVALLLAALSVHPLDVAHPTGDLETLVARLWADLAAVGPQTAELARRAVVDTGDLTTAISVSIALAPKPTPKHRKHTQHE